MAAATPSGPGFLIVFSEPGEQVSLDEYQDWYNNEHVPLRMNHLSSFLTGARYHCSSSTHSMSPSLLSAWVAMYDITSTTVFSDPSYTRLRAHRSPREADLVKRLEILDRRTCVALQDSTSVNPSSSPSSSFHPANPIEWIIIQTADVQAQDLGASIETPLTVPDRESHFNRWTLSVFDKVTSIPGWTRTRTFRCYDNLISGTAVAQSGPEAQKVPEFLMIHELLSSESADLLKDVITPEQDARITTVDARLWKLYRAYPGIAQGNI